MWKSPETIKELQQMFSRLPGVGEKSAFRHVMSILNWSHHEIELFSHRLEALKRLRKCRVCHVTCEEDVCSICLDESRSQEKVICVTENFNDFMAIENSGTYRGQYYILGGVINPLIGIAPQELGIDLLIKRIINDNIVAVILALNPSLEGDATCSYIRSKLPDIIKVQRIGFGVPIGGSLEHLDPLTISKALENRKEL